MDERRRPSTLSSHSKLGVSPNSEFPKQPSRKDGLGKMCTEHWKVYVKGLREARRAP